MGVSGAGGFSKKFARMFKTHVDKSGPWRQIVNMGFKQSFEVPSVEPKKEDHVASARPSNLSRRRLLLGGTTALGAGAVGLMVGRHGQAEAVKAARFYGDDILGQRAKAPLWYRHKLIGQPVMDTQLLFWLGQASSGLTDIGEVLDTATRIKPGDEVSWFDAWIGTAKRVQGYGDAAKAGGHGRSAAAHFLRAGAYYRAGLIRYARREDPRIVKATRLALDLHDRALKMRGYDSHVVRIPYESGTLYGRMHYAPGVDRASTLILHQGLHAWPEDTMWVVDGALKRGYHVLSFHGPGQGASLRLSGHVFRPDWEVPVARVIDFAEKDGRVNRQRLILMGLSFGGYLAPRAASYEHRLHALIADPGVLNWGRAMLRHFEDMPGLMPLYRQGPRAFDVAIGAVSKIMPDARWYFDDATWKHGVSTPHALIDELAKYDNTARVKRIRCKTLVMEGSAEDATPGESRRLYDALTCAKHWMYFDASTAAQTHCQGGSQTLAQARLFDWLDEEVGSRA